MIIKRITAVTLAATVVFAMVSPARIQASAKKKSNTGTTKNLVVVLDPGHDLMHHGCQYMGVDEANVNLCLAMLCKQELEKYKGVTVYLTRSGIECPYGSDPNSTSACLSGRVNLAKAVKANVIVSLHNDYDADGDVTVNGSKVIIQNANYRPALWSVDMNLATSILSELTKVGLNINNWKLCPNGTGIVTRNSATTTYPDGSPSDYYAILNKAKSANIPAVIIEHAYLSNDSDRINFLSNPANLQAIAAADARAIASSFGLSMR
ncbi:MAG: N-acetylmuramoyl-L-alanine amidase [Lachnospiraceae bacterium]|nr:N-acetylmuramoyl-L-alanine amidase [Lachnospiraceae bacterium]